MPAAEEFCVAKSKSGSKENSGAQTPMSIGGGGGGGVMEGEWKLVGRVADGAGLIGGGGE